VLKQILALGQNVVYCWQLSICGRRPQILNSCQQKPPVLKQEQIKKGHKQPTVVGLEALVGKANGCVRVLSYKTY
jgi:hypothetical protein